MYRMSSDDYDLGSIIPICSHKIPWNKCKECEKENVRVLEKLLKEIKNASS